MYKGGLIKTIDTVIGIHIIFFTLNPPLSYLRVMKRPCIHPWVSWGIILVTPFISILVMHVPSSYVKPLFYLHIPFVESAVVDKIIVPYVHSDYRMHYDRLDDDILSWASCMGKNSMKCWGGGLELGQFIISSMIIMTRTIIPWTLLLPVFITFIVGLLHFALKGLVREYRVGFWEADTDSNILDVVSRLRENETVDAAFAALMEMHKATEVDGTPFNPNVTITME